MITRKVKSLDEDFKALGLISEGEAVSLSFLDEGKKPKEEPEEESEEEDPEEPAEEAKKKACEGDDCSAGSDVPPKSKKEGDEEDDEEEDEEEEDEEKEEKKEDEDDALDSPEVNMEMLDAIAGLPISEMDTDDIADVLEALKTKVLPDGDDKLAERAEEIVDVLVMEAVAKKTRRAKAGSMAKKASFQCPEGTRKDPEDPGGRRCVKAAKAVGGRGKLLRQDRGKLRWSEKGAGKKSQKKSDRWAARREDETVSPFALELAGLLENDDVQVEDAVTIRGEIIDRIGSIMEMLHEEFLDENVTSVMEGVYECIVDAMEEGTLDESAMDEDAFIAELKAPLQLIAKSLGQIEQNEGSELGNE